MGYKGQVIVLKLAKPYFDRSYEILLSRLRGLRKKRILSYMIVFFTTHVFRCDIQLRIISSRVHTILYNYKPIFLFQLTAFFSYTWRIGPFLCTSVAYIQNVSMVCSVLTLTVMSIERSEILKQIDQKAPVHPLKKYQTILHWKTPSA